jgi:hypothetical protein
MEDSQEIVLRMVTSRKKHSMAVAIHCTKAAPAEQKAYSHHREVRAMATMTVTQINRGLELI